MEGFVFTFNTPCILILEYVSFCLQLYEATPAELEFSEDSNFPVAFDSSRRIIIQSPVRIATSISMFKRPSSFPKFLLLVRGNSSCCLGLRLMLVQAKLVEEGQKKSTVILDVDVALN
jgi:hypothetical protein